VKVLLARNAKVYIACRSRAKAESAITDLQAAVPHNKATFLELDLGSLDSVKNAAQEFLRQEPRLDILVNNAWATLLAYLWDRS
jgi:retinol dehydrogenase 12